MPPISDPQSVSRPAVVLATPEEPIEGGPATAVQPLVDPELANDDPMEIASEGLVRVHGAESSIPSAMALSARIQGALNRLVLVGALRLLVEVVVPSDETVEGGDTTKPDAPESSGDKIAAEAVSAVTIRTKAITTVAANPRTKPSSGGSGFGAVPCLLTVPALLCSPSNGTPHTTATFPKQINVSKTNDPTNGVGGVKTVDPAQYNNAT